MIAQPVLDFFERDAVTCALICLRYKAVYRFDPDLSVVLAEQAHDDKIPTQALLQMPFPAVYIESALEHMPSAFAWLEHDGRDDTAELRFWVPGQGGIPLCLRLDAPTIEGCIDSLLDMGDAAALRMMPELGTPEIAERYEALRREAAQRMVRAVTPLVSHVLYLCSQELELTPIPSRRVRPLADLLHIEVVSLLP